MRYEPRNGYVALHRVLPPSRGGIIVPSDMTPSAFVFSSESNDSFWLSGPDSCYQAGDVWFVHQADLAPAICVQKPSRGGILLQQADDLIECKVTRGHADIEGAVLLRRAVTDAAPHVADGIICVGAHQVIALARP